MRTFEIVLLFAHSMAQQSRPEKTQCFSSKMFQKNPQHPALLCEQDLKQDCVGAKRPPRNFKHPDLSPVNVFWKDCSSAFHWCEAAVRVFWSIPSAPDCWTAATPRTPKEFLGVQGVQTCNRCGRGCWPWWGFVFQIGKSWRDFFCFAQRQWSACVPCLCVTDARLWNERIRV